MDHTILNQRLDNLPASVWNRIAQIDEIKGHWIAGVRFGPRVSGRLKKSVLVTSTGASTRIEGARLSDEDVEKLMRGIDIQQFPDRDKQGVQGYYELLNNVFDSWDRLRFTELIEELIASGDLKLDAAKTGSVTSLDPCYLGRQNDVILPPRDILQSSGADLVEMALNSEKSFCCGAGGAQMPIKDVAQIIVGGLD